MSEIYDASRTSRAAIGALEDTTSSRGGDIWTELRNVVEELRGIKSVLRGIKSVLRDISDVLHAQYYGDKTSEEEEASSDEE